MNLSNSARVRGRFTATPELKTFDNFSTVQGTIAVQNNYKSKDGSYGTQFISYRAVNKVAELITGKFEKGDIISCEGPIIVEPYEDKEGNKRTSTYVRVENIDFLASTTKKNHPTNESKPSNDELGEEFDDDEMPF